MPGIETANPAINTAANFAISPESDSGETPRDDGPDLLPVSQCYLSNTAVLQVPVTHLLEKLYSIGWFLSCLPVNSEAGDCQHRR